MTLLPTKTTLESDLAALDESILRSGETLNHAAAVLKREHTLIWSLPDDRLLAVLNANVERTVAISAAKDKIATEINAMLDELGLERFSNRAPVGLGRDDIALDGGTFAIVTDDAE